ncbi:MAG: hypothetical protein EI684_08010 [Candidatus Viridilinea halotolerans]|uniref:Uncharacterized protein n=1 Tax=Candidatus Viridilinea halotolerans TaxID=2491704 RepID=A0A426U2N5_9CHLR|nr:MAG: hypothetical protein EI684_08010 [Candidatus Viridilinea halotolerans]
MSTDPASQEDLERVREIILGPDASRQRLRGAEVDRLREILFGPQIEAYERQLADLRRDLERMTSDLNDAHDRIAEAEKSAARRMELLELNLRKLVEDQRREQERQRSRDAQVQQLVAQSRQHEETIVGVGEGLLDLRKVHSASELEIRAARTAVSDMQDQIEQRTQAMRRDLRHAEDTLRAEVRHMTDRLDHQKTDRKALASMLIEVATRLETGNSMTGLLEGLAGAKE